MSTGIPLWSNTGLIISKLTLVPNNSFERQIMIFTSASIFNMSEESSSGTIDPTTLKIYLHMAEGVFVLPII